MKLIQKLFHSLIKNLLILWKKEVLQKVLIYQKIFLEKGTLKDSVKVLNNQINKNNPSSYYNKEKMVSYEERKKNNKYL